MSSPSITRSDTRVHVLDVLRGIALLGMFLVHFSEYATDGGRVDAAYQWIVEHFFVERFWAMFGILFGVGFAIQFRRAEARGERYLPKYLRRMAALAACGFFAHAILGFNVLLGYAAWGLVLPLVRRWSTRALVVALLFSAASYNLYLIGQTAWGVARHGEPAFLAERTSVVERNDAFREANNAAQDSPDFGTVVAARLEHMRWFYAQPWSFLPVNTLTLFLLGVLGLGLGLFDRPGEHRGLIVALMAFGVLSWTFETWMPVPEFPEATPMLREMTLTRLMFGMGWIRGMWLVFTYIGAILLLVDRNPAWLSRLAAFGWSGRMALTSYMIQIALLDLLFSNYALGVSMRPLAGLAVAVALFLAIAGFSRFWLARHPLGPLEWLWRSATYARWQPWRATAVLALALAAAPVTLACGTKPEAPAAEAPAPEAAEPEEAPEMPPIGIIDFFGLRKVAEADVRRALQIREGDPVRPEAMEEAAKRLAAVPGVLHGRFELVCCEEGKTILYVGIEEPGAPTPDMNQEPGGSVRLPEGIVSDGREFQTALFEAVQKGDAGEDHSQGHALNNAPALRAIQERFVAYAADNTEVLRDVLQHSSDAENRALAAQVLGYAPDKRAVVPDLVRAMRDPAENVRNNAARALLVIAQYAQQSPERGIEVPLDPFIAMLDSPVWTDRNKSSWALSELTKTRDPAALAKIRAKALPSLVEMARWKSRGHAEPSVFMLGRIAGMSEEAIAEAWKSGDRERIIEAARGSH
jgi:uncharacterized protein